MLNVIVSTGLMVGGTIAIVLAVLGTVPGAVAALGIASVFVGYVIQPAIPTDSYDYPTRMNGIK